MQFIDKLFQMPSLEFTEDDLRELFEYFDPEKIDREGIPQVTKPQQEVEPARNNSLESLLLLSMY
jgi:hypothetical protein